MVYRVFICKEVILDADSWEEACKTALYDDNAENVIQVDEYLDDERNGDNDYTAV